MIEVAVVVNSQHGWCCCLRTRGLQNCSIFSTAVVACARLFCRIATLYYGWCCLCARELQNGPLLLACTWPLLIKHIWPAGLLRCCSILQSCHLLNYSALLAAGLAMARPARPTPGPQNRYNLYTWPGPVSAADLLRCCTILHC